MSGAGASSTASRITAAVWLVAVAGCLIASINMGLRGTLGFYLAPMTADLEMTRETFALALAAQNLIWGVFTPVFGVVADKYGSLRVMIAGALLYGAGLFVMGNAESIFEFNVGAGLLIGLAQAGTGFGVVLGAVGRRVPEQHRSLALGVASAGGSFGQFYMTPLGQGLIEAHGWMTSLLYLAAIAMILAPLAYAMTRVKARDEQSASPGDASRPRERTLREMLGEAHGHQGYILLTAGFFVCGFQVSFITVHLPAYLRDLAMEPAVAATALSLVGLFNIIGTYGCGWLGGKARKKYVLSWLYFLRALCIAVMLIMPKTELNMLIFAAVMGLFWLGTVPLTSGLVASMFGVRYLSTLFGITFLSHQIGSFLGVWLGGYLYDQTGSYDLVWYGSIGLGIAAALIHLPIPESRPARAPA